MIENCKEVLFFCYGDARAASTWSNVPYCFVKALEKRGIAVECVDIKPDAWIDSFWNSTVKRFINLLRRNNDYYFERSWLAECISYHKIRRAVRGNMNAELCIFTSFSYWNKFDSRPSLLLCDWTYEMLITERFHRQPCFIEKRYVLQQKKAICNASLVVSLFKNSAETMKLRFPSANICWPGINVINNLYDGVIDDCLIGLKKINDIVLFVGKPAYLSGAKMLAEAMLKIWESHPSMELHCIGITQEQLGADDERIVCHGYLRKDVPEEREMYYGLLCRSRVFCNPTPEWAGFSSTVEAMYFYTPVVVSNYDNFVEEFGHNIEFGRYNVSFDGGSLSKNLLAVIDNPDFTTMCLCAHETVRNYTWDEYVQRVEDFCNHTSL